MGGGVFSVSSNDRGGDEDEPPVDSFLAGGRGGGIANAGPAGRVVLGACGSGAGGRLSMSSTKGGESDCRGGRLGGTSSDKGEGALWWRSRGEVERGSWGEREEYWSSMGTGGRGISGGGGRTGGMEGDVER